MGAALVLTLTLGACGGGGGGGGSSADTTKSATSGSAASATSATTAPTTNTSVAVATSTDGKLHAACTNCGAADDSTYSGSGTGLWQALNETDQSSVVNVTLGNVAGKHVSLVFTNEGASQSMSSIAANQDMTSSVSKSAVSSSKTLSSVNAPPLSFDSTRLQTIHEFNRTGWTSFTNASPDANSTSAAQLPASTSKAAAQSNVVGSTTRMFWIGEDSNRQMTLEGTQQTSDGTTINLWVETAEYGSAKVSAGIVQQLLKTYAGAGGVYDLVTSIGGPFWGATNHTGVIAANNQPIDIVVANLTPDGKAFGELGYFYALNNFVNQGSGPTAHSNQDLSIYVDSETLYLGGTLGCQVIKSVMAHESQHMQSFYRRAMLLGADYVFDTWLEEMMAMMMEDWLSTSLDASYAPIRDDRVVSFLSYAGHGGYSCSLTTWTPVASACDSYAMNGSFGGFLNRQLGLAFYKSMLTDKSSTNSLTALNNVIAQYRAGSSVAQEFRYFTATTDGQVPANANVARYSFASRTDNGLTLVPIDPSAFTRDLPSSSPGTLASLSSFPAARSNVPATYSESVTVPAHSTLTVIIR
ncbi:hemagglutinin [Caballeronia sp. BR00000012568055]|uniref:M30 family zinc metallopeptidase n=1 Tax=Caballeronia sp. BR00000012568055 TaxID=2918761 RepID=UPI0023F7625C